MHAIMSLILIVPLLLGVAFITLAERKLLGVRVYTCYQWPILKSYCAEYQLKFISYKRILLIQLIQIFPVK